jgi:SNF2 family DNA or RNA helicase
MKKALCNRGGAGSGGSELLILDEAHRLKNEVSATRTALSRIPCRRRVLLTGTPMQNDLVEFFSVSGHFRLAISLYCVVHVVVLV